VAPLKEESLQKLTKPKVELRTGVWSAKVAYLFRFGNRESRVFLSTAKVNAWASTLRRKTSANVNE
jgi:hypothetical protein